IGTVATLAEQGIPSWRLATWSQDRRRLEMEGPLAALGWLAERGLLMILSGPYGGASGASVPAEVELALRGGLLYDRWTPRPPEAEIVRVFDPGDPVRTADPARVIAEMAALLDEWGVRPPPALKRGGMGVRDLRRTSRALGLEEPLVQFLYALAAELDLVVQNGERIVPSDEAGPWSRRPP